MEDTMEMRYRTLTAAGTPCCATNHIEHLCARCRAQVTQAMRATQARPTTATTRPATPSPAAPRATPILVDAADHFRLSLASFRVPGGAR